jgi:uncharacterized protein YbjT (DUF2867 family)
MELANVLLIGGSGFVGGWIASRLSENGVRVTIPTRHRENTKKLIMLPTVEMVEANVHDPQVLVELMRGQDAVINLVGVLHDSDSRLPYGKGFAAAHVELPRKIVAAMRESGVRRLVHMSALRAAHRCAIRISALEGRRRERWCGPRWPNSTSRFFVRR